MNRLSNKILEKINYIYSNWDNIENIEINEDVNIFFKEKIIKHNKKNEINILLNTIEDNLKTILIFNKESKEYTISLKNNNNLTYIFSNNLDGFVIMNNEEILQSNMNIKPYYEKEISDLIVDIEENLLINDIYLKDIKNINILKEKETLKTSNVEKSIEDNQLDLILELDSENIIKQKYNFTEKFKLLTGISLLDNENESYAKANKLYFNIDLNKEDSFSKVILFSILNTEKFIDINIDVQDLLLLFFSNNKNKVNNINLFAIRQEKYLENGEFVHKLLKNDEFLVEKIKLNKKNNINIYIDLNENEFDIVGFGYDKIKYTINKNKNILDSEFYMEIDQDLIEMLTKDKIFINENSIIDNKLYFNKDNDNKDVNFYLGYESEQLIKNQKEIKTINKEAILLKTINILSEENNIYKKHYVMLENIKELINGYLKNSELVYKENPENETQKIQKEYLEMLFNVKDFYIKDISMLSKEEDNWTKKRKIKKIKKMIDLINQKIKKT
jgi:hypothetical protein